MRIVKAILLGLLLSIVATPIGGMIGAGIYILLTIPKPQIKKSDAQLKKESKLTFNKRRKL